MNIPAGCDRPARILLLEHDPENRARLAGLLAPAFAPSPVIVETDASPAACAALRADPVDVMLIDLDSLAGETGDMQAGLTRLCRIGSAGITVAMSGDRSVSAAVAALQAGAHDYLPKPVSATILVERLEELARRHGRAAAVRVDLPEKVAAADIEGRAAMPPCRPLSTPPSVHILPMWQQEQRIIEETVAHFGGNISRAAAALEISPSTIYRKRQSWERMTPGISGAA